MNAVRACVSQVDEEKKDVTLAQVFEQMNLSAYDLRCVCLCMCAFVCVPFFPPSLFPAHHNMRMRS